MESILPYLIWGGLFFLMMRFGCGSHMFGHRHGDQAQAGQGGHAGGHGCCGPSHKAPAKDHEESQARPVPPATQRDPVCGKSVAVADAKTSVHAGTIHYFCARDCREIFEAAPETYLVDAAKTPARSAIPLVEHHAHADHGDGHATHR